MSSAAVDDPRGPWRDALRHIASDRRALLAALVLGLVGLVALLAPLVAPYDPAAIPDMVGMKALPPSPEHPFGTDGYSRDVLSRVIHGARVSLGLSFLAVVLSSVVGTAYGAVAGWFGGALDAVLMRTVDAFMSIPRVLLLVAVAALWGQLPVAGLVLLLGFTSWFGVARLVRSEVRALREREFVVAARALGVPNRRLLWRHTLPHALGPVLVAATLGVGDLIVIEAGLSFLGLGVAPPAASWGSVIQDGVENVARWWWISMFPGIALVTTVLAVNVLADGLREALDPRQLPGR